MFVYNKKPRRKVHFPPVLTLFVAVMMRDGANRQEIWEHLVEHGYSLDDSRDAVDTVFRYTN